MASKNKTTERTWPRSGDVSVNSSARMVRRAESPLVAVYGSSCPPGCYVARSGVVTSDPNYAPPSPDH